MTHASPLIAIIVGGLGLAFVLGTLAQRLKLSPLVGYLLAGVAVGPFTPGYVADQELATQLADIGVILLMFGVGLRFSPQELLSVKGVVVPGALVQIVVSTLLGMGLAHLLGWNAGAGLVFGMAISVASTVVLLRALQERRILDSERGHLAVGWLVFQDLLTVAALVLIPPLSGLLKGGGEAIDIGQLAVTLAITLGKAALFVVLMLVVGKRVVPAILHYIAHTGSRELFRLAVLSLALCVAFAAAELFGVSFALGAFFAGMILSESQLSQAAAEEALPFRDAFAVLFFVSVGMLIDPLVLIHEPLALIGTLLLVMVGNAAIATVAIRLLGQPIGLALTIGAGLAQIGEFSFILADLGIGEGILPERARGLILGTSIITIVVNPFLFAALARLEPQLQARFRDPAKPLPEPPKPALTPTMLSDHAVLIGYGRVGGLVGERLRAADWPLLVIEEQIRPVEALRRQGVEAFAANAAGGPALQAAGLDRARLLVVAIPQAFEAGQIVEQARRVNPRLRIVARAHLEAEIDHLRRLGADEVIMGEREIALAMVAYAKTLSPEVKA